MRSCVNAHLTDDAKTKLYVLLTKYEHLFDDTLTVWNNEPYNIELKERVKSYHSRSFPVPKIREQTLKLELKQLCEVGVLKNINHSEWAASTLTKTSSRSAS